MPRDRNRQPERGEWEPIKISFKIDPSTYIPEISPNPQPKVCENSYGQAISQQHPKKLRGSKTGKTPQTAALLSQTGLTSITDRSDRLGWKLNFQTGQTGYPDRSDRSLPDSPQQKLQMANLEQTKSKSNETWRIPSQLFREHILKRSFPKD